MTRLLPALLALLVCATACSSVDVSSAASSTSGPVEQETSARAASFETVSCGTLDFPVTAAADAGGRLPDAAVAAFSTGALSLGAPERWSVLLQDDDHLAIIDRVPVDSQRDLYWVRITQPGSGIGLFDGLCRFAVDTELQVGDRPGAPASCEVQVDELVPALVPVWAGAEPGTDIVVIRDGVEIHVLGADVGSGDNELLTLRRSEHGEPAVPSAGERDGGYLDVTAQPGQPHAYAVVARSSAGDSDVLECGVATMPAVESFVTCAVGSDPLGWPSVSWETGTPTTVTLFRDGLPLEPDAVTFASPYVDRSIDPGATVTYELMTADGASVSCGQITLSATPAGSSELQRAAANNVNDFPGPFQYVTLEPICASCEGQTVEVYLVPDPASVARHTVASVWVDGIESSADGLWLIDPLFVPDLLLRAEADRLVVDWTIDPTTGLVLQWTIEGEGARLLCLEVDTRPIDMRDERCGRLNLLSG